MLRETAIALTDDVDDGVLDANVSTGAFGDGATQKLVVTPEIGVPPVIIHFHRNFHQKNHPFYGIASFYDTSCTARCHCSTRYFSTVTQLSSSRSLASPAPGQRLPVGSSPFEGWG